MTAKCFLIKWRQRPLYVGRKPQLHIPCYFCGRKRHQRAQEQRGVQLATNVENKAIGKRFVVPNSLRKRLFLHNYSNLRLFILQKTSNSNREDKWTLLHSIIGPRKLWEFYTRKINSYHSNYRAPSFNYRFRGICKPCKTSQAVLFYTIVSFW